ncbi:ubiquitinyl hydrolase 1 [Ancylostoma duodenale]|uniref:Ubiquitinyl hydrolase 1 n=1 Tax=Ancylostoma duodenale TaxID=51022 RepID=A0A0C2GZ23_9BILA|nr:ubiquitinyl hydrolase 1 [Ancylostoma duodenale]
MTAEQAVSGALVCCEHRNKKSLFKAKEVRKKLKSAKRLCEECERAAKNGTVPPPSEEVFICVSCGYLTCPAHAKKHWEAARTGEKHPLILSLDSCVIRCQACNVQLNPLDDPQDLVKLFSNEYRSFSKTRVEPRVTRKPNEQKSSCNGVVPTQHGPKIILPVSKVEPTGVLPSNGSVELYNVNDDRPKQVKKERSKEVTLTDTMIPAKPATISVPADPTPLNSVVRGFIAEFHCGASPSPGLVFSQISCKTPRFKGYQQQDAHELLRYLLDGLRSEELERYKSGIASYFGVSAKISKKKVDSETVKIAKGYLQAAGRPLLDMVFGGTLLQTIHCSECGHVSERHEQVVFYCPVSPFLDLSIPVTLAGSGRSRPGRSVAVSDKRQAQVKKRGRGKRRVSVQNDNVNEDDIVTPSGPCNPFEEYEEFTDDEMERLVAGVNRLDFTKVLVRPPEEYKDGVCSIGSCLLEFTAPEQLQGANAYECESCCAPRNKKMNAVGSHKKRVSAMKRYLIYEPPAVLTLHLKRFQQLEGLTGRMAARKLSGHVYFPVMFDMAPFCCRNVERIAPGEKRLLYSLYGVVVHSGSLSGGHYIAYVKSRHRLKQDLPVDPQLQNDGQWYYCSDSQIVAVSENRVLSAEAYILFYERVL